MQEEHFVSGEIYNRQKLHDKYGGQRQGGISTPKGQDFIFLFSSRRGKESGYSDEWDDPIYFYFGEGTKGDMSFTKGNKAILNHINNGKRLYLFKGDQREYIGEFQYYDHHYREAPDFDSKLRIAIVFELILVNRISDIEIESLRQKATDDLSNSPEEIRRTIITRKRSYYIKEYVLKRADGFCEGCGEVAPFITKSGKPYLEAHHIERLADGGADHPSRVIALCPNCHARVHYSEDGDQFNKKLKTYLYELEG